VRWLWRPGLRVAHAVTNNRALCGEVTGYINQPWVPSARKHCATCTRRLPKPLEWTEGWPDCVDCAQFLSRPFMAEAIASVGIETRIDVKRLVEQYHNNRHQEDT
jgi:hypothetical protein